MYTLLFIPYLDTCSLMRTNLKCLLVNSILLQIYIHHCAFIRIEVIDNYPSHLLIDQYANAILDNIVHYGKTRILTPKIDLEM